jgi:hypothetical protein
MEPYCIKTRYKHCGVYDLCILWRNHNIFLRKWLTMQGTLQGKQEIARILDISDAFCILRTTDVKAK